MGSTKLKEKEEKKEKVEEKKVEKPKEIPKKKEVELKEIVRVIGADLDGSKPLRRALIKIKGINYSFCKAVCNVSGFDPNARLGSLAETDIKKIEEIIKNPLKFGVPIWMVNRRKDVDTGKDLHLSSSDIDVAKRFDVQKLIDIKSYRGVRHMLGLPTRGQRTRSSFRKGRSVGVVRKSVRILQDKGGKEKKEEKK